MDPDVARLVRDQRLVDAAELASERGDARSASELFERACDFGRAAEEAFRAGDFGRALPLALEGKHDEAAERALPELLRDPVNAERVSFHLERRGDHVWCGRILEAIGKRRLAARAYEKGGEAIKAATLLEAEGEVIGAAKVLEAQLRREPQRDALHVALGGILLRYGKVDAAIRSLQKVRPEATERRAALTLLLGALERIGLTQARVEAEQELATLGGALESSPEIAPLSSVRARLFGRYEIVREVASSPSARVLECLDGVRSERVAVKIFAGYDARGAGRDALARFEREVRVLGTLNHPNIVPLRDYLPEGPALVLSWMAHGTLEQMLAREPLTPSRAVEIAQAVLSALGEAHRLGVIHRDVKPANVLFDEAGVTRLGDFGVAHLSDLSATATAGIIGTLGYMSPEQREGRPASVRSDVFAVGAMLWEMLTGERPDALASGATLRTRPSGIHRDLDSRHDSLVLSFLASEPKDRPDDAFAARRALGAVRWPDTIERAAAPRVERPKSNHPTALRFEQQLDGTAVDRLLDRRVVALVLDAPTLARASVFARADHPALQAVLRVDRELEAIWLALPRGVPLARPLTAEQAGALREGLARLHELGAVHGAVDAEHVVVDDEGGVVLAFSGAPGPTATADLDRLALARLAAS
ncbi:MAG: Serine/threonine protein kinase PrkC, regulator of stationary phase [Labilithrix sp.]|nr:Serine/threonine protein kinase PrkC, regulator of stationary phase [Labilithrix sp.]